MEIATKRIYEPPSPEDGVRILVDRLWPRGLSKIAAAIDLWAKEVAPSNELRKWYGHAPEKWPEFRRRYFAELRENPSALRPVLEAVGRGCVTLLYSSREKRFHNAAALKDYLEAEFGHHSKGARRST